MSISTAPGVAFDDTATRSYATNIITNDFLALLADARNNSTVTWNYIKDAAGFDVSGRFCLWPVQVERNTGHGSVRVGGALPDPTSEGYRTYTTEVRTKYARIKVTGDILRRGKTNGGAFFTAVEREMDSTMDNVMISLAREIHNDGSGRLGMVSATISGGTTAVPVKFNTAIEGAASLMSGTTALLGKPTMYLEVGDRVSFATAAGVLRAVGSQNAFFVTSVSPTSFTIGLTMGGTSVLASAFTVAPTADDWIIRASNTAITDVKSSGLMTEMSGFGAFLSDIDVNDGNGLGGAQQSGANNYTGTATGFQGIASSGNLFNQGIVIDNGGSGLRSLSEALMQRTISDAEEINNADVDLIVSPFGTYNSYVALLTPEKRYNNTTELKGGHKVLDFNGLPVVKDRFCYPGRMMFLATSNVRRFTTEPLRPLAYEGVATWERTPDDTDSYYTGWVVSENVGVLVRNKTGALLTELNA